MGRPATTPLTNPLQIVATRGRAYITRKKYVQVHVFTTFYGEVSTLIHTFGGKYYRHGSGFTWMLATRDDLESLARVLRTSGGSTNKIENIIESFYPTTNKRETG